MDPQRHLRSTRRQAERLSQGDAPNDLLADGIRAKSAPATPTPLTEDTTMAFRTASH
jgi:hypothetical protein